MDSFSWQLSNSVVLKWLLAEFVNQNLILVFLMHFLGNLMETVQKAVVQLELGKLTLQVPFFDNKNPTTTHFGT